MILPNNKIANDTDNNNTYYQGNRIRNITNN